MIKLVEPMKSSICHTFIGLYYVKEHSDSKQKYTEDDIINML